MITPERAAVVRETLMDVAGKLHASMIYGEMLLKRNPDDVWLRDHVEKRRQQAQDHASLADFIEREFAL